MKRVAVLVLLALVLLSATCASATSTSAERRLQRQLRRRRGFFGDLAKKLAGGALSSLASTGKVDKQGLFSTLANGVSNMPGLRGPIGSIVRNVGSGVLNDLGSSGKVDKKKLLGNVASGLSSLPVAGRVGTAIRDVGVSALNSLASGNKPNARSLIGTAVGALTGNSATSASSTPGATPPIVPPANSPAYTAGTESVATPDNTNPVPFNPNCNIGGLTACLQAGTGESCFAQNGCNPGDENYRPGATPQFATARLVLPAALRESKPELAKFADTMAEQLGVAIDTSGEQASLVLEGGAGGQPAQVDVSSWTSAQVAQYLIGAIPPQGTSTSQPTQPAAQPGQPATQPTQPVAQPTQPVTQPVVTQPGAAVHRGGLLNGFTFGTSPHRVCTPTG